MRTFGTVLVAVTASVLVTAALVSADGGGSDRVHACILSGTPSDAPNVRIVGADDSCPAGSTATHWAVQGPPGGSGPAGSQGPPGPPPNSTQIATAVTDHGGLPVASDEVRARSKFSRVTPKSVTAICPDHLPDVITGNYSEFPRATTQWASGLPLGGSDRVLFFDQVTVRPPRGAPREGWRVRYSRRPVEGERLTKKPWRLTVTVRCMKTIK